MARSAGKAPHGDPEHPEYGGYFCEYSSNDTTYYRIKDNIGHFTNDTIAPSYFKNGIFTRDDFQTAYIMGKDPYFTAYFYEIRSISSRTQPLNAVIISGRVDKETSVVVDTINHTVDTVVTPIIRDLRWGIETMKYYQEGTSISQIIALGYLPSKGDVLLLKNNGVAHSGEYNEQE